MKTLAYISSIFVVFLFACNSSEEELTTTSEWRLIEVLADPGDGSGTFQPVQSEKTITFHEDGTVSSNGSLCNMTTNVGNGYSGTFNEQDSTISVIGCDFAPPFPLSVESSGENLILNYPCIEPCREKYEQVN